MDRPVMGWDEKRREWMKSHRTFGSRDETRVLVLTGSQPTPCKNPAGDNLLLRLFKNKVDYCRIHGYGIFYNNAILNPKMRSFWAKIPLVRAAMVAHPEVEWMFWVDSDAMFTDMEFKVPLERYKYHNLVVHGWPDLIYEQKSWVGVNAGIFLIRNCQWSMDFLQKWASMGPISPDYARWGKILRSTLKDKLFPESDDQSALVYLLLKEHKEWGDMIYVENEYFLHGYWREIVGKLDIIDEKHEDAERRAPELRKRHAETVTETFAEARQRHVAAECRRPFITHFTGCQPCSGEHNPEYRENSCGVEMGRALNFADNQVLRNYGFRHNNLTEGSTFIPLPFDFPGDESDELI
ncbi:glycosyltransferase 7-like [Dorcoceras hygrometricum]|uniref:Glycosyltransferase 7-like n=1 Tax=Dorcoceras hygrometricum TaxID=472368 RepID=A0A2Z7DCJ5_9LAMI|nr:glycosyltransferase 7-like [Dorcoceras hygrometricum]